MSDDYNNRLEKAKQWLIVQRNVWATRTTSSKESKDVVQMLDDAIEAIWRYQELM